MDPYLICVTVDFCALRAFGLKRSIAGAFAITFSRQNLTGENVLFKKGTYPKGYSKLHLMR